MNVQVEAMKDKSERTCVGCGKPGDRESLVRVVLGPRADGEAGAPVAVDLASGKHGRGAHVHARKDCLVKAAKGGLAKSFKTKVAATADDLAAQIVEGCDRRIAGLLGGAWRARLLAVGADAVTGALDAGAPMVVVATDAGGLVERGAVARAIADGKGVAWKNKATLGALLGGREEVAVCAVLNESLAAEVASARRLGDSVSGRLRDGDGSGQGTRGDACRSREDR